MSSTPVAVLVTAATDSNIPTERLVRAAQVLARALLDNEFSAWCAAELGGYNGGDLPVYRKVGAMLMAVDHYGNDVPVSTSNVTGSMREMLDLCPINASLSRVAECAAVGDDYSFKIELHPDFEKRLLPSIQGARSVHRIVQRSSFSAILAAARQRVFDWAIDRLHQSPELPAGLDMHVLLGLPQGQAVADPIPVQARGMVDLSKAQLAGPVQIVLHSPGASATQTHSTGADLSVLKELLQALERAVSHAKEAGEDTPAAVEAIAELKALVAMQQPRPSWIKESLKSLRTVLEGAGGALLGELSKPHVQALLAQAVKAWS